MGMERRQREVGGEREGEEEKEEERRMTGKGYGLCKRLKK